MEKSTGPGPGPAEATSLVYKSPEVFLTWQRDLITNPGEPGMLACVLCFSDPLKCTSGFWKFQGCLGGSVSVKIMVGEFKPWDQAPC